MVATRPTTLTIAVVGLGYVGTALAVLLASHHPVRATDVDASRVAAVNGRRSPVGDPDIGPALRSGALDLIATTDPVAAYLEADLVFVATPTDYDPDTDAFDTTSVDAVVDDVARWNPARWWWSSRRSRSGTRAGCAPSTPGCGCCSHPSSSARAERSTTACTRAG